MDIIQIDGAQGEGGGQVLRTALTLSMCTGRSVAVRNIREGRRKPGLLRQHLAALRAAATISDAEVTGDVLGSRSITFVPDRIRSGRYEFAIGSAGSCTLLMQTILPALAMGSHESVVEVTGGTHNGMAPSVDFIERSFLPVMAKLGLAVDSHLVTHGFYPNGGGRWRVAIQPWQVRTPLSLHSRGDLIRHSAVAKVSLLPESIAQREIGRVRRKLCWPNARMTAEVVESPGPGNIVSVRIEHEHVTAVFESVGSLGVSAERVAGRVATEAERYLNAEHVVCNHLADQLLVPMVLGHGGSFTTEVLSSHSTTNIAVIERVLGRRLFDLQIQDDGSADPLVLLNVSRAGGDSLGSRDLMVR